MATREGRQQALEQMTVEQLEEFHSTKWGGRWFNPNDLAKSIRTILRTSTIDNRDDDLDQALGLPTSAEQQLEIQRKALATSESSTQASWLSAHAGWIGVVIALVALIVAIIALLDE